MSASFAAFLAVQAPTSAIKNMPSFGDALIRMCVSLGIIVVILVVLAVVVRRLRRGRIAPQSGGSMRVVESLDLDLRHRLYKVSVGGESLVLGVAGDQITLLSRRDDDSSPTGDVAKASTPSALLRKAALDLTQRTTA